MQRELGATASPFYRQGSNACFLDRTHDHTKHNISGNVIMSEFSQGSESYAHHLAEPQNQFGTVAKRQHVMTAWTTIWRNGCLPQVSKAGDSASCPEAVKD